MSFLKKHWWKFALGLVILLIALAAIYLLQAKDKPFNNSTNKQSSENSTASQAQKKSCSGDFSGITPARDSAVGAFTSPITNIDSISHIAPGKDVFEPRFTYLWIKNSQSIPVYAPADGTLFRILYKGSPGDYDLFFLVDCQTAYRINHVTDPNPAITSLSPITEPLEIGSNGIVGLTNENSTPKENIAVKAGEQIGTTTGTNLAHNWDYSAYIDGKAVCPYEQYPEPLRSAWLAKLGDKNQIIAGTKCEISGGGL